MQQQSFPTTIIQVFSRVDEYLKVQIYLWYVLVHVIHSMYMAAFLWIALFMHKNAIYISFSTSNKDEIIHITHINWFTAAVFFF